MQYIFIHDILVLVTLLITTHLLKGLQMKTFFELQKLQNQLIHEQAQRLDYLIEHLSIAAHAVKNKSDRAWYPSIKFSGRTLTAMESVIEIGDEFEPFVTSANYLSVNHEKTAIIKELMQMITHCRSEKANEPLSNIEQAIADRLNARVPNNSRFIIEINGKTVKRD